MKLKVNGIEVDCILGDLPEERERVQKILVDLEIDFYTVADITDELDDTIDYVFIAKKVSAALVEAKCRMLERAARIVAETVMSVTDAHSVKAAVTKFGAVPGIRSATAVFEILNDGQ